jgi:hypothetical protein
MEKEDADRQMDEACISRLFNSAPPREMHFEIMQ